MVEIDSKEKLISSGAEPDKRKLILEALEHTINQLRPEVLLKEKISFDGSKITIEGVEFPITGKIYVIGTGKASGVMAQTIEQMMPIEKGVVAVLQGTAANFNCKKIELIEGSHPFPNQGSVNAARKMIALADEIKTGDIVICLISGGGSSLLCLPLEGISLDRKIAVIKKLMDAGADIGELNAVRKSISQIKGGKLAMKFHKAKLINLILCDVIKQPISYVASGPTVLDRFTYARAREVLEDYGMWDDDLDYCKAIEKGYATTRLPFGMEKSKPQIHTMVMGDNNLAVEIAAKFLAKKGLTIHKYYEVEGEAQVMGRRFGYLLNHDQNFVAGCETTVTVKGKGKGGRNMEFALSAAMHMNKGTLASMGTDGQDRVAQAGGAIVDSKIKERAGKLRLNISDYLNNNDSFTFFQKLGDGLLVTGPTGTNVCDIVIGLV